jgi:coiled-coil domain-containing protein 55
MSGKGGLDYGLNQRNNNKRKKGGGVRLTGFADNDDASDDSLSEIAAGPLSGRSAINREIVAEQAALRKRAEAAMASSKVDLAVYDYDGEYDSFASAGKKESPSTNTQQKEAGGRGQSRYISNLLKSAQRRTQEQEIIYERKVAKEQAEEDGNTEYEGKEKFITSAYKKKLAEREEWAKEEEERAKREAAADVTQKKGGDFLFAGFGRNVLMGGMNNKKTDQSSGKGPVRDDYAPDKTNGKKKPTDNADQQSYQRREDSSQSQEVSTTRGCDANNFFSRNSQPSERIENLKASSCETKEPRSRSQILAERAVKIREARERYFKRRGLPTQ